MSHYEKWMELALREAEAASAAGELPIGGLLVAGERVIGRAQTSVVREGSIVAHGELMVLLQAKHEVWSADRPLILVTTLEPCLMCLGAAMQCQVDEIVFGMRCAPDGAASMVEQIKAAGQSPPKIVGGVSEAECVEVFQRWPQSSEHPAFGYVAAILAGYDRKPLAGS